MVACQEEEKDGGRKINIDERELDQSAANTLRIQRQRKRPNLNGDIFEFVQALDLGAAKS